MMMKCTKLTQLHDALLVTRVSATKLIGCRAAAAVSELQSRLDLTTTHRQTWLFNSTSTYHSTILLTARGVALLVVHRTSGSTSYETIPHVRLETSGGVLSTVDMVVHRRDGPRRLRDRADDDESSLVQFCSTVVNACLEGEQSCEVARQSSTTPS